MIGRKKIQKNTRATLRGSGAYRRQLAGRYDGPERLALADYNAVHGAVDRPGQTVPPYREPGDYVSKVKGIAGTASTAGVASASTGGRTKIYRVVDVVDGQEVVTYTDRAPASR